jgi:hypothetical protein
MKAILICGSTCCLLAGCCAATSTDNGSSISVKHAKLTAKKLEERGFRSGGSGSYDIDIITLGELCEMVSCKFDDFSPIYGAGPTFSANPKHFDGGDIRALYWHLSEDTYFDESAESNPTTPVRASVILYDKKNPRLVIKRALNAPGEKPLFEYEPRPQPKR